MKEVNAPKCERENDLIGFLYEELNDAEAQSFQRHARDCASCHAELAAFRDIREAVVTWRNESLGIISSPTGRLATASMAGQKPSALAALKTFFNLAPLWTKGAVAFASVLFVLLAALAVVRLHGGQGVEPTLTPVVAGPGSGNSYSAEQINAMVEQRVQEELQRIKSATQQVSPSPLITAKTTQSPRRQVLNKGNESASNQKARRPLSRSEREQLAADLRLIYDKPENEIDLIGDRINQ